MNEIIQAIPQVIEALSPLANKVGTGAEELFGWFVLRAYAELTMPIVSVILMLITSHIIKANWPAIKKSQEPEEVVPELLVSVPCLIVGVMSSVAFLSNIKEAIQAVVAPEAWAVMEIMKMVN